MTASRTAELISRLPGWFVEHARVTEEKARRRREVQAKRYEILCGEEVKGGWSHTIVEFAKRPAVPRPASAPAPTPLPAAEPAQRERRAQPSGTEWREFLTPEELRDLTGRRSLSSQLDALKADRIPHKLLRSRLLVSRFHVREWLADRLHAKVGGGAQLAIIG